MGNANTILYNSNNAGAPMNDGTGAVPAMKDWSNAMTYSKSEIWIGSGAVRRCNKMK
jgi:hypothetical protein